MPNTRDAYDHVAGIYFPIAIGVFALIAVVLVALLVRGARRHQAGARSEATGVESAYAVGLACVVAFLVWTTFRAETPIDHPVAHPGLRITVIAAQWSWLFQYPNGTTVSAVATWSPPVALVPTGVEVEFDGRSQDVIHGFWVPMLRFQRQLLPGSTTRFDLLFTRPGYYSGECSVFCGLEHSQMHFALRAVSQRAFARWLAQQGATR